MDVATARTAPATDRQLGQAAVISGLLGVVAGLLTAAYPASAPESQWSYPFEPGVLLVVSVVLALAHVMTAAGFVGVLRVDPHRGSRVAVVGLSVAVAGFLALAVCELASGAIAEQSDTSSAASVLNTAFGVSSLLTAFGSIVAGVVIARARVWAGPARGVVLVSGLVMVVVVTPALVSGNLVLGQLALVVWSLTFVVLGRAIAYSRSTG